jgi:acylphosphatase
MALMHYDIRIKGMVQGVSFRENCLKKALSLGISGWVRNDPDGNVSVVAEGDGKKLKEFISWCYHGPQFARVDKVLVSPGEFQQLAGFEIKF